MKFLYILGLITVASASVAVNDISGRIISGLSASADDSFTFRVLSVADDYAITASVSSGAAISEYFGLIVAQAVEGFHSWYIGYDSIHVDEQLIQSINRSNIITHPNYDETTLQHNIAVVKFTNPVSNYRPLATTVPSFPAIIGFGYGYTIPAAQTVPSTLQFLSLLVQSNVIACDTYYPSFNSDSALCATMGTASFFADGDQGGAVTDFTRTVLHGIVSYWGYDDESPLVIVNIPYYLTFIQESRDILSPPEESSEEISGEI